jgi:hypothetical protein
VAIAPQHKIWLNHHRQKRQWKILRIQEKLHLNQPNAIAAILSKYLD